MADSEPPTGDQLLLLPGKVLLKVPDVQLEVLFIRVLSKIIQDMFSLSPV